MYFILFLPKGTATVAPAEASISMPESSLTLCADKMT